MTITIESVSYRKQLATAEQAVPVIRKNESSQRVGPVCRNRGKT
jgi:hypothetical protein